MKRFFVASSTLLWMLSVWYTRTLPLLEISDPSCKHLHRSDHSPSCKIPFSLPDDESLFKSPTITTQKLFFSVLYKWSYFNWHDGAGWHPGIDIVSAKWTPLYAIEDGIVITASNKTGYGNTIVIQHTLPDGNLIYSNYWHLDTIYIHPWSHVKEWQKIWEIGNTWFTMWPLWNHVDFQITTELSPTHPYSYSDCTSSYMEAVQQWSCRQHLYTATLDPLVFLQSRIDSWSNIPMPSHDNTHSPSASDQKHINNPISKTDHSTSTPPTQDSSWKIAWELIDTLTSTTTSQSPNVSNTTLSSSAQVLEHDNLDNNTPSRQFSRASTTTLPTLRLDQGTLTSLRIPISDDTWASVTWLLDVPYTITTSSNVSSLTDQFQFVLWWEKRILIRWENTWKGTIVVSRWDQVVYSKSIIVE